ncbi:MAG: M24 family metallopeptidase, partial [Mitsuokella jalaludinii]|nr:M24 family metallopeptidase [Mitsuokella jalaludinii]
KYDLAQYFGHGLGHSLGLEIHEEPRLSPSSTCEHLAVGMLITDEPGVYLPGWGGLRIEDTVLVTATGSERLTKSSKALLEIR